MTLGERFAAASLDLVGTRFRLNGRDPATGLDCVGLVQSALDGCGVRATAPTGYRLRQGSIEAMLRSVPANFVAAGNEPTEPGDLLLVRPGPAQHHLCIAVAWDAFVHAHAGLRRVVRQPGPLPWPRLRAWRLQPEP